ncbi:hypothetical protein ACFL0Q_01335 [Thermodesulfobacteriota bacterium]
MKNKDGMHLGEDLLLRALVDEADMNAQQRAHLSTCHVCRAARQRYERELVRLGEKARHTVPPMGPTARFDLPERRSRAASLWKWSGAMGFAAAAALVLFVLYWPHDKMPQMQGDPNALLAGDWPKEPLMVEVHQLSEDPFSGLLDAISGEAYSAVDEDFVDFVISPLEQEPLSGGMVRKGGKSC